MQQFFQELDLRIRRLFPTPRLHSSYASDERDGETTDPTDAEDLVGLGLLGENEKTSSPSTSPPSTPERGHLRRRRKRNSRIGIALFATGLCLIILGVSFPPSFPSATRVRHPEGWIYQPKESKAEDHNFHVIIPVFEADVETCKTLLTGAVLNYPTPWIVSWYAEGEEAKGVEDRDDGKGGRNSTSPLPKMESILQMLEALPSKNDNDTVLITGNAETLFQLRPEVLLQRYMSLRDRDDRRVAEIVGKQWPSNHTLVSKVLFAADKTCPSVGLDGAGCRGIKAPPTTPKQIDADSTYYLTHDILLGRVDHVRTLYQVAVLNAQKASSSRAPFTEHSIFSDLYASQEAQRQTLFQLAKPENAHKTALSSSTIQSDFGITVDFSGMLRHAASHHSDNTAWLRYDFENDERGGLSKDIASSSPPFWTVDNRLPTTPWSRVPLLINDHTTKVPALIQNRGQAEFWTEWYGKLWFHPHGRALLDNYAMTGSVPNAVFVDARGTEQRFWDAKFGKPGARAGDGQLFDWDEICGDEEVAEEVFRDGKGPWKDPRP